MRDCPDIDRVYLKDPAGHPHRRAGPHAGSRRSRRQLGDTAARAALPRDDRAVAVDLLDRPRARRRGRADRLRRRWATARSLPEVRAHRWPTCARSATGSTSTTGARPGLRVLRPPGRRRGAARRGAAGLRRRVPAPPDRRRRDDHDAPPAARARASSTASTSLIEEVGRVRAELGYPIMVTPFPQMVISQALFNVIGRALRQRARPGHPLRAGQLRPADRSDRAGRARPDPRPAAGRARSRPSRRRRRPRSCAGSSARRSATRSSCCGPHMPAEQVDAMVAAGPSPRHLQPRAGPRSRPAAGAGRPPVRPRPGDLQAGPAPVRPPPPGGSRLPEPGGAVLDRLRRLRGFVLDMDGTLVLGDRNNQGLHALPGAVELVQALDERGLAVLRVHQRHREDPRGVRRTRCSSRLPGPRRRGAHPGHRGCRRLPRRGHRRVMVLGGKGITEPLEAAGIEALPPLRGTTADAVFAGWYRQELTFEALEAACFAVLEGRVSTAPPSRPSSPPRKGARWVRHAPSAPSPRHHPRTSHRRRQTVAAGTADVGPAPGRSGCRAGGGR